MTRLSPTHRRGWVACCALLLSLVCSSAVPAADPPAGLRVFYTGHSFHMFVPQRVDQLAKSAGITTHKTAGVQGIGGSRVIQHWDLEEGKNRAKPALVSGNVDVFTMAAHLAIPDAGIENFVDLGLMHNPNLRLLVQASWMPFDATAIDKRVRTNDERDGIDLDALQMATDTWRQKLEAQVDALNQRHGKVAVFIVPVGDAVNTLRRQIKDGKFPGVTKQAELFRDPIGHGNGHIQALASYCNYVAIYHHNPTGLTLPEPGVTPEQHAILQQIAWDTVASYKYAGVVK